MYGATQYQPERRYIIALLWHHPTLNELSYIGSSYQVMEVYFIDLEKYPIDHSLT
jgi:hypothetical protein